MREDEDNFGELVLFSYLSLSPEVEVTWPVLHHQAPNAVTSLASRILNTILWPLL